MGTAPALKQGDPYYTDSWVTLITPAQNCTKVGRAESGGKVIR